MERPDVAADEPRDDVIVGEQGDTSAASASSMSLRRAPING